MHAMWAGLPLLKVKVATVDDTRLLIPLNSSDAFCGFGCAPALTIVTINSAAVRTILAKNLSVGFIEHINTENRPTLQTQTIFDKLLLVSRMALKSVIHTQD